MNEADTRALSIDPKLQAAGWGVSEDSKILREHPITDGKIQGAGVRMKAEIADYVLVYKNQKIAVIEAKKDELPASEGVAQAKSYAQKLQTPYTYATNGKEIYEIRMEEGTEGPVDRFPTPEELWTRLNVHSNEWKTKFDAIPFHISSSDKKPRYYQENAVNKTLDALADGKQRILLTLATGTGKTFIAFQIAWKLFQARWNLKRDGARRPRILFLADRNILATQAFNSFSAFPEEALTRIKPDEIRKKGAVPKSESLFFTIFQTFMSGPNGSPYFGDYEPDFFDFIIIDECHRGGANDESNWRAILEYFSPAVQLGLTATPKRKDNTDTYRYFGEPVYSYSLKQGIGDGFLTPFRVRKIQTTLDNYIYTSDDEIVEGEVEEGRVYEEESFNRIIQIKEREAKRVQILLDEIDPSEKTLIFCATQEHAAAVRDLVNQYTKNTHPNYCARVTANDGARGDQFLKEFQDSEKSIPTILTTSQKLSTGVDARNVRNIVLLRPVKSMIEFKQIVGRGTRLFDGKAYFTIFDFVEAYKHFNDPEWDGEPIDISTEKPEKTYDQLPSEPQILTLRSEEELYNEGKKKLIIKLADGKEREIQHMASTLFWGSEGKPVSSQEFMQNLFGQLPAFFKSEEELRQIWSNPMTRKSLLQKIAALGYGKEELENLQKLVHAEKSDLFDALAYLAFTLKPIPRQQRVRQSETEIFHGLNEDEKEFVEFVLSKYVEAGVEELEEEKLSKLLELKYKSLYDGQKKLGGVDRIRKVFFEFQKVLYSKVGE